MGKIIKRGKDIKIIYLISILVYILAIIIKGANICCDSPTYTGAIDLFKSGQIDSFRTPTYPLFLWLTKTIFPASLWLKGTICIQYVIFAFSVYYFYKLSLRFSGSKRISFWVTLFYAIYPGIIFYNNMMLTESLAISGSVFILYSAIRIYDSGKIKDVIVFLWWLLFLIFLRPAFVYMIPVFGLSMILMFFLKKDRVKAAVIAFLGIVMITGLLLGYMYQFKKENGVFTCSKVTVINTYMTLRANHVLTPEVIKDENLRNFVKHHDGIDRRQDEIYFGEAQLAVLLFNIKSINDLCLDLIKSDKARYAKIKLKQLYMSFVFSPHLTELYIFLAIYSILLLLYIIKNRKFPWVYFLMYMLAVSIIIVAWIGAGIDMPRLLKPAISIYLLMISQCLGMFGIKKNITNLFQ